jgi:hypothetical protein
VIALIQCSMGTVLVEGELKMKLLGRFIAVAAVSVCIAWLLSFLPEVNSRPSVDRKELQVFNDDKPITLSNENIVDWIETLPLRLELKRVDWSDRILSVDFQAGAPIESSEVIFAQMLDFIYYGLAGTTNVNRVWVRLVLQPEGEGKQPKRLLLALDAHREQISREEYDLWKLKKISAEQLIARRFQLTATPQWRRLQQD